MTNGADPDQLAFSEANWSGSILFAKIGHDVFSKRRVKIEYTCIWNNEKEAILDSSKLVSVAGITKTRLFKYTETFTTKKTPKNFR